MFLFPREEISVPLHVPETEFLARLNEALVPTRLRLLFRNGFVGSASESAVTIRWARRWGSNDLAPQFEGRVTPDGVITEFPLSSATAGATGLTAGSDRQPPTRLSNRLWVAQSGGNSIAYLSFK